MGLGNFNLESEMSNISTLDFLNPIKVFAKIINVSSKISLKKILHHRCSTWRRNQTMISVGLIASGVGVIRIAVEGRKPAPAVRPGEFPARKPITRGNVVQISQFVTRKIQFP